jgi:predicted TIM-barrel fold metal-dependent hydrolase
LIIDVHSHVKDSNDPKEVTWFPGEPEGPVRLERFAELARAEPVDRMLVSAHSSLLGTPGGLRAGNAATAEAVRRWPDFFSGLCQVNPHFPEESMTEMDEHLAGGNMVGLGELCQYLLDYETDDPRMDPFVERAIELDVPLEYHASTEAHTAGLGRLAARFPRAKLIMSHLGGMHNWPAGLRVALEHENIWAETSGMVMLRPGAMRAWLDGVGAGRVMFGVDFDLVLAAPLVKALLDLDLPAADLEKVAWRNAAELFKLDVPAASS